LGSCDLGIGAAGLGLSAEGKRWERAGLAAGPAEERRGEKGEQAEGERFWAFGAKLKWREFSILFGFSFISKPFDHLH
jgi:hypothetical protein